MDMKWDTRDGSDFILDPELFTSAMEDNNHGLLNLPSLGVNEWTVADHGDYVLPYDLNLGLLPTMETPSAGGSSSSVSKGHTASHHSRPDKYAEYLTPPLSSGCRDHDCPQEVCEILSRLSNINLMKGHSTPSGTAASVPLDHMLRLNREASEQLRRLLTCPCAKSANLVLLYASNISRVMLWYQQAAACTSSPSWRQASLTPDATSQNTSPAASSPDYSSGSGTGSTNWSSMGTHSTFHTGATTGGTHSEMSVTTAKMAIGTFDVDDLRVQTALKIQLLLGEMRRASQLIDQFVTSHGAGHQCRDDEPNFGGLDTLYQSLDSWLRDEHSRITNWMKARLRELNS
ncbi:hypothetical protein N7462_000626 [Penicillium macrosclerotiorum]|uniref:uncharacterized protein n=1 Tax=Penicillium macrosclerotiorum TaxID=303699 RepID=UPI002548F945|nr:uncharacterized protein N7462_000626 [Penicillium macrosclerotiorum]KAJ5698621.1 hypothetical protein N7462_000626 [Penicillium macrosclerotiorum]